MIPPARTPLRRFVRVFATVVLTLATFASVPAEAAPRSAPVVTAVSPSAGPVSGGTTITISGTDLRGASKVVIGGSAATIRTVSASAITVSTPSHAAGTVDVQVVTRSGTSAVTSASKFSYYATAASSASVKVTDEQLELMICAGSPCASLVVTTAGFTTTSVNCKVTNTDRGALPISWTQGPNETRHTYSIISGVSFVEVTCNGVTGRDGTWGP